MSKRSDLMTKGPERVPHRSLLRADGFTDWEMERPIIGIANSFNEIIPGHIHLDKLVDAVNAGIAMNHVGMKYSLPSRELIADSLEIMATAHPFDGLVLMASCDKIIPDHCRRHGLGRLHQHSLAYSGHCLLCRNRYSQQKTKYQAFERGYSKSVGARVIKRLGHSPMQAPRPSQNTSATTLALPSIISSAPSAQPETR